MMKPSTPPGSAGEMPAGGLLTPVRKKVVRRVGSTVGSRVSLQELKAEKVVPRQPSKTGFAAGMPARRSVSLPIKPEKPGTPSGFRPTSPNSMWQQTTLASLKYLPKEEEDEFIPRAGGGFRGMRKAVTLKHEISISAFEKEESAPPEDDTTSAGEERRPSTADAADKKAKQEASQLEALKGLLPNVEAVLARLRGGGEGGFSDSEMDRMHGAFMHHRVPDSNDIHKDDLAEVLKHLGYCQVETTEVMKIANDITEFATMEYGEFVTFCTKYAQEEAIKYHNIFERFDEDNSGSLDEEEIMKFLSAVGYVPLRSSVKEAMAMVDLDGNGTLDFEELVLLINLYRLHEGFSADEVARLGQLFAAEQAEPTSPGAAKNKKTRFAAQPMIESTKLSEVLTQFFGISHRQMARSLSTEMASKHKPADDEVDRKDLPVTLRFSEALVWARRLREMEIEQFREAFEKFDADGSGAIDMEELEEALKTLGYTLTQKTMTWLIQKAVEDGNFPALEGDGLPEELDFDAFVHFMRVLGETDGFMPHELAEIKSTFERFDEDGSGDIDVIELNDMLHFMGCATKLDTMQNLIGQVHDSPDGALDMRGFVRFMRLHREAVLGSCREVFDHFKDAEGMVMELDARKALFVLQEETNKPLGSLSGRLAEVALVGVDPTGDERIMAMEIGGPIGFARFVELADDCRTRRTMELRKHAGFTAAEIARFRELFDKFDDKKTGLLRNEQVWWLLTALGHQFRNAEERDQVAEQLERARARARECGATVAPAPCVNFWVLVQLLRDLFRRDDRQTLDKVSKAAQLSKFSSAEVSEFQDVFSNWYERDALVYSEGGTGEAPPETPAGSPLAMVAEDTKMLTKSSFIRLMRGLGLKLSGDHRAALEDKLKEYAEGDRVDFAAFLRLMRWILDSNFAGVAQVVTSK